MFSSIDVKWSCSIIRNVSKIYNVISYYPNVRVHAIVLHWKRKISKWDLSNLHHSVVLVLSGQSITSDAQQSRTNDTDDHVKIRWRCTEIDQTSQDEYSRKLDEGFFSWCSSSIFKKSMNDYKRHRRPIEKISRWMNYWLKLLVFANSIKLSKNEANSMELLSFLFDRCWKTITNVYITKIINSVP